MNKHTYSILTLGLLLMLAVSPAHAQSRVVEGHATIPFDFAISDQTLPAGAYTVERVSQRSNVLLLRSAASSTSMVFITWPAKLLNGLKQPKLVFNRYGDEYFLTQVWSANDSAAHQLHKCRRERVLVRELARQATARRQQV